jgi:hypothetical protein
MKCSEFRKLLHESGRWGDASEFIFLCGFEEVEKCGKEDFLGRYDRRSNSGLGEPRDGVGDSRCACCSGMYVVRTIM